MRHHHRLIAPDGVTAIDFDDADATLCRVGRVNYGGYLPNPSGKITSAADVHYAYVDCSGCAACEESGTA